MTRPPDGIVPDPKYQTSVIPEHHISCYGGRKSTQDSEYIQINKKKSPRKKAAPPRYTVYVFQ